MHKNMFEQLKKNYQYIVFANTLFYQRKIKFSEIFKNLYTFIHSNFDWKLGD